MLKFSSQEGMQDQLKDMLETYLLVGNQLQEYSMMHTHK